MTDDELKELVAANSRAIGRLEGLQEENARQWEQQREENRASRDESARLWELQREENRASREESERLWELQREENRASRKESERLWEEIRASRVETDRVITSIEKRLDDIHKELGGIGNTLGGVSEGLCSPAVARIMRDRFQMTQIGYRIEARRNGKSIELDVFGHTGVFGHANDRIHQAYVAEIKTTLDQDAINQLHNELRLFPEFFPHHRGKELYGILAAVNAPAKLQEKVLKDG
ncbi:MAG: hypothetical protein GY856_35915, partial [bacterium]|nr:hypothetical protein [bacterium]